jgi:hypothetical protein
MMNDQEAGISQLQSLRVEAPGDTMDRLHRRLRYLQLSKDLVERQAFAFWIIFDQVLRWMFVRRG